MNNGQVPGGNVPVVMGMPVNVSAISGNMIPAYNGNQGLQFVQNPSGHFMVSAPLSFLSCACYLLTPCFLYCFVGMFFKSVFLALLTVLLI